MTTRRIQNTTIPIVCFLLQISCVPVYGSEVIPMETFEKTIQDCWEGSWGGFPIENGRQGDGSVWYVNQHATGENTGLDWDNAFPRLEDALAVAGNSDEVWVASGIYIPPVGDDPAVGYFIQSGVDLYGGFSGSEVAREERNPDPFTNETILSGDRLGNDEDAFEVNDTRREDNAPSILRYENPDNIIDGFTVAGANSEYISGTGLLAVADDEHGNNRYRLQARNMRFIANAFRQEFAAAGAGGAIFAVYLDTVMENVTFEHNSSDSGGAFWAIGGDHRMTNVVFRHNAAEFSGGAMGLCDANLELRNGIFENNHVDGDGGALFMRGGVATMADFSFSGNMADLGGAISAGSMTLMNGYFRDNEARIGGAMRTSRKKVLANVLFSGNRAEELGGAVYLSFSGYDSEWVNLTFAGNYAGNSGGAIHMASLERFGGDRFSNILAYGNGEHAITIGEANDDFPIWRNCLLEGSGGSGEAWDATLGVDGGRNLDADPLFFQPLSPEDAPTTGGNYEVLVGSPVLDAGDNSLLPADVLDLNDNGDTEEPLPFDLNGNPRIQNGTVDLGAYEGTVNGIYHSADRDGSGAINLSEILRVIQFFNSPGLHCAEGSEDGYAVGVDEAAQDCAPHSSDYNPQDWRISLSEVLRAVQIFNTGAYFPCPEGEDGFCVRAV